MPSTGPIRFCSLPHDEVISATASLRRCKRSLSTPVIIARGISNTKHKRADPEQFDDGAMAPPKRRLRFWQQRWRLNLGHAAMLNQRNRLGNELKQQYRQLPGTGKRRGCTRAWVTSPFGKGEG